MDPRGMAAEQLLSSLGGGGEAPPMEEAPMEQEAALAGEEAGAMDLESALAGVDAALEGMGESTVREIRNHLEAIRDIASREGGGEETEAALEEAGVPMDVPDGGLGAPSAEGEEMLG